MDILRQFYDKKLWYLWGGAVVFHIIAFFVQHTWWSVIPLVSLGLLVFLSMLKKPELALALAFFEIFIGGHGHLFDVAMGGFSVSLRMVIFVAVMIGWLVLLMQKKMVPCFILKRDAPWLLFGSALSIGAVRGFLTNDFSKAFDDFNSYVTVLYIFPIISIDWTREKLRLLTVTFFGAAVFMAFSTLGLLFAFTHLPGNILRELYVFVRDARLAEVTILTVPANLSTFFPTGDWYFRIFEQSQFIVLAFELLLAAGTFILYTQKNEQLPRAIWFIHLAMLATIYASLSRSFFLAMFAAALVLFGSFIAERLRLKLLIKRAVLFGLMKASALVILWLLVVFPIPFRPDFKTSPFYKEGVSGERGAAVSSRWNLLGPMLEEISSAPLLGSGFGEEVAFVTDDPRIRAINPSGEYETYRFEWGYQDLWLKMGLLGLLAPFFILLSFGQSAWNSLVNKLQERWLTIGLFAGLCALFVTHVFSPYLNHPIGLGILIFALPFFPWANSAKMSERVAIVSLTSSTPLTSFNPITSVQTHQNNLE